MSNGPRQGQSIITIDKERSLASAMSISMRVARPTFAKFPNYTYWHLDANAGSGRNTLVHVDGSPIVFQRLADELMPNVRREVFFCDKDKAALRELQVRTYSDWPTSHLLPGDNEDALEVFSERIRRTENPKYALGTVIVDPNGYWYRNANGDGPPTLGLVRFAAAFPRIDIVLNLNTQAGKRQVGAGYDMPAASDVLASLHKKFWLVKRTQAAGNEFLLAVGRNFETGDHRSLGFFKLKSEEGRSIMRQVEGEHEWLLLDA